MFCFGLFFPFFLIAYINTRYCWRSYEDVLILGVNRNFKELLLIYTSYMSSQQWISFKKGKRQPHYCNFWKVSWWWFVTAECYDISQLHNIREITLMSMFGFLLSLLRDLWTKTLGQITFVWYSLLNDATQLFMNLEFFAILIIILWEKQFQFGIHL